MSSKTPRFKYRLESAKNKSPCIELDGEIIHTIPNIGEFYKYLGYSPELALKGVLPEEFVWETYVKENKQDCASCFQLHIIDYLIRYSTSFAKKFGPDCQKLVAPLSAKKAACSVKVCRARKFVNPKMA